MGCSFGFGTYLVHLIKYKPASPIHQGLAGWLLGDRDSNPDYMVQSHVSCRWTISQRLLGKSKFN
jgi:hypothetical protein